MMSHELRTPLAAIRLTDSMLQMYGDQSSKEENGNRMRRSTSREYHE
jgi:signal transduction histidine kinase